MTSQPPSVGPATVETPATAPHMPNAAPRLDGGKIIVIVDSVCGVSSAPPRPCTIRKMIIWVGFCANPQAAEAAVKTISPIRKSCFGPYRSPRRPAVISRTAYTRMYAFKIHSTSDRPAFRCRLICGMATFTIVVSSRIMKKPRHSAVRINQGLYFVCNVLP